MSNNKEKRTVLLACLACLPVLLVCLFAYSLSCLPVLLACLFGPDRTSRQARQASKTGYMLGTLIKISSGRYLHPTRGLLNQEGKDFHSHTPETSSTRGRRICIYTYIDIDIDIYVYIHTYICLLYTSPSPRD